MHSTVSWTWELSRLIVEIHYAWEWVHKAPCTQALHLIALMHLSRTMECFSMKSNFGNEICHPSSETGDCGWGRRWYLRVGEVTVLSIIIVPILLPFHAIGDGKLQGCLNRPVARKRKYAWNAWRHIRLLFLQHVKYCGEWLNRQVGALKRARGYNYTDNPI